MDVKNETEQDVDYKVVNGGPPMDGAPVPADGPGWNPLTPGQCVAVPVGPGTVVVIFRKSGALVAQKRALDSQSVKLNGPPYQASVQDGLICG